MEEVSGRKCSQYRKKQGVYREEEGGRGREEGRKKRERRQKRRERRLLLSPQDPLVSKISSPRFHVEFSSWKFLWKNTDFHSIH